MNQLRKKISQINRLDALIRREATGDPEVLADRFKVSKPTIIRYIQVLKDLDAPILYCRDKRCYYYSDPGFKLNLNKI